MENIQTTLENLVENLRGLQEFEIASDNLCEEIASLKIYLEKFEARYSCKPAFLERLAEEIRPVVYQAEDTIETYIVHVSRSKLRGSVSFALRTIDNAMELRRVGKEVDGMKRKVQDLCENEKPEIVNIEEMPDQRRKALRMEEDVLVGFDDQVENIIHHLMNGEPEQLEVIPIIGSEGIGKTTLATKVLIDPRIEYEFYPRVLVQVSEEYERKELFLKILGAFTLITEEISKMSVESIAEIISEKLQIRKYLIVLDDILTQEVWHDLKDAFPSINGSRVLITSRSISVGHISSKPHHLHPLNQDKSQILLRRKVFGENTCPIELEKYESDILSRCGGIPLAIILVAGVLLNHPEEIDWWKRVVGSLNESVALGSEEENELIRLIRLGFNYLPYRLKPCFLYLGVFRKGSEIPVRKLLQLWIAEGFAQQARSKTLEEIAEDYLEDLIARNLLTVEKRRSNGKIKTCRIHNILHTFCKEQAKKENLFEEITRFERPTDSSGSAFANDASRRLCIDSHAMDYISSKPSRKFVRSLLSFGKESFVVPLDLLSSISKAFKLLKVLDIRPIKLTGFPAEVYYLVLLKHIAISCDLKILPEKMSILRNLQTLIVETSLSSLEIKADIWKMKQLRHLYTNTSTYLHLAQKEPSAQENLQTLSTISPECCRKEVFEKTPKLKKLGIRGKLATVTEANGESNWFDSLVKLESLENLKIVNDDLFPTLQALPQEERFPRNLKSLTLKNTLLDWSQMHVLGKLEYLEVLKLKDNAFQGESWQTEHGGFHRLQVLLIGRTNLAFWEASASHFPVLRSLSLRYCTELKAIPTSFGDIVSLQNIDLYCTNGMVASSARKIQLLKLEELVDHSNPRSSRFRLSVYPPDR